MSDGETSLRLTMRERKVCTNDGGLQRRKYVPR
jgi:hypothetical protein